MGHHHPGCCPCEGTCKCTCSNCSDTAPCCFKVVIADMAEGSCGSCADLDGTYYLPQEPDEPCKWSLSDACRTFDCDPDDITLEVLLDGSDYKIRVTLGGHTWEKNYSTSKPDCCGLSGESLTHTTSAGDCDSDSATCVITASETACPTECCDDNCLNGEAPDCLKVVITGMVEGAAGVPCPDARCTECMDGTYYLPLTAACTYGAGPAVCTLCDLGWLSAVIYKDGADYKLKVEFTAGAIKHRWIKDFGTGKPDCLGWSSESLTLDADGDDKCSSASATCVVSSAHGATPTTWSGLQIDGLATGNGLCGDCNTVPIEFLIVISGLVSFPGGCDICNDTSVVATRSTCSWPAVGSNDYGNCTVTLTPISDTVMEVDLSILGANIKFRKTYGIQQDCTSWAAESYSYFSKSGTFCDQSAATITVTSL